LTRASGVDDLGSALLKVPDGLVIQMVNFLVDLINHRKTLLGDLAELADEGDWALLHNYQDGFMLRIQCGNWTAWQTHIPAYKTLNWPAYNGSRAPRLAEDLV
jgi:hypothetical protein